MALNTSGNLKLAAQRLATLLKEGHLALSLRFRDEKPWKTRTGGYGVTLARFGSSRPDIEVWLDKWLDGNTLVFWAGFGATEAKQIRKLISDSSYEPPIIIMKGGKDTREVKNGQYALTSRPSPEELDAPFEEHYTGVHAFGLYSTRSDHFDAIKMNMFIVSMLRDLPEFSGLDDYEGVENRKTIRTHLDAERDAKLSLRRKLKDQYICQVCSFDFEKCYGPLEKKFAEAHHIVPLADLNGPVKNTIDDLITVCANCHRMLHRLKGEAGDIGALRARVHAQQHQQKIAS